MNGSCARKYIFGDILFKLEWSKKVSNKKKYFFGIGMDCPEIMYKNLVKKTTKK